MVLCRVTCGEKGRWYTVKRLSWLSVILIQWEKRTFKVDVQVGISFLHRLFSLGKYWRGRDGIYLESTPILAYCSCRTFCITSNWNVAAFSGYRNLYRNLYMTFVEAWNMIERDWYFWLNEKKVSHPYGKILANRGVVECSILYLQPESLFSAEYFQ